MSGRPYLSDSGRNLHENSSQNALEPRKCNDQELPNLVFTFCQLLQGSLIKTFFFPANKRLRRHLKGGGTIRISFNSNDFSLFSRGGGWATRALVGEFSMSSWGHISMSGRDYACWRNNFQIMQILGVLCEPQFIRSIVVHPSIVGKW